MAIYKNKMVIASDSAKIQTIDNLEDSFYYAFKNGSNYYYTKSKSEGSTAYYQFTYADSKLTKIVDKGNVTVSLNANGVPQITVNSTVYTLDETNNGYYIVDDEQVVPSAKAATQDLTTNDLDRIFEGFYITPPNPTWKYVGILAATGGATLTVGDDWTEMLIVSRVAEGSYYYNLVNVIPKVAFTQGSPTNNEVMTGFYWNESYYCKSRIGIAGTGTNRYVKKGYTDQTGWAVAGFYIYKR